MRQQSGTCSTTIWASIEEKIKEAQALYDFSKSSLQNDAHIRRLLETLDQKVEASREAMRALGVTDACRQCEEEEGGSCCGVGIENHYTSLFLLINLLLGITLPDERTFPDSCYFLGSRGCYLKARDVLCVNYLCTKIQRWMPHAKIIDLQHIIGEELDTGLALYEAIKKVINR
jgi:hypothetical protein